MTKPAVLLHLGNYRQQFADFLDRLAAGTANDVEWSSFIITHYRDEFLEEMRRCTVRLRIGELRHRLDSNEGRQILHAWAIAIRSAAHEDGEPDIAVDDRT